MGATKKTPAKGGRSRTNSRFNTRKKSQGNSTPRNAEKETVDELMERTARQGKVVTESVLEPTVAQKWAREKRDKEVRKQYAKYRKLAEAHSRALKSLRDVRVDPNKVVGLKKTPRAPMLKDLKRSGLTDADARKADYKPLSAKDTKHLTGIYAESYLIPYHDVKGNETEFWQVRYTEVPIGAFGIVRKKPPRYSQLLRTLPYFYFPARVDWTGISQDVNEPLAITEGEKKAEKACKSGIPCIAVGGVWAWRSKKKGIPAIADFDCIKWKDRRVWLVFDNDLMTNPLVIGALAALSSELHKRGAHVYIKSLPKGKKNKGLDDYLIRHDKKAFLKLREDEYKKSAHLWRLNDRLAFIQCVSATYDFYTGKMYPTQATLQYQFHDDHFDEPKANGEGFKKVYSVDAWADWPERRKYFDIGYYPGDDPVVEVDGVDKINTWPGWKCEPKRGDIKPFVDLLNFIFEGEPEPLRWFWQWLAYPLQNPGEKCLNAVLLHSTAQGVGKSFIGYIMGEIYGDNFNVVSQEDLQSSFNDWVVCKQFILGEEITGNNSRREADRLKNMITREVVNVNKKYEPVYKMPDCANYLFTSNHIDALFLESSDRRTFVHEIRGPAKPDAFYKRVDRWRKSDAGPAALFYYLLNDVDVSDFDPKAPALPTDAKVAMIDAGKSAVDLFAEEVRDNPDGVLRLGFEVVEDQLLTLGRLTAFANSLPGASNHSPPAVAKALRRVGFRQYVVYTVDGTKRLWAIRRPDYWDARTTKEMANYYERLNGGPNFK